MLRNIRLLNSMALDVCKQMWVAKSNQIINFFMENISAVSLFLSSPLLSKPIKGTTFFSGFYPIEFSKRHIDTGVSA